MKNGKIKHFTHRADLDGVVSGIIGLCYASFETKAHELQYVDYNDINEEINAWLDSADLSEYYKILITDISVNRQTAARLNDLAYKKIILLDHHETAMELNNYTWAYVNTYHGNRLTCGAELALEKLPFPEGSRDSVVKFYGEIVEYTRKYDTWEWAKEEVDYPIAKQLNDLLHLYGRDKFVEEIMFCGLEFLDNHSDILHTLKQKDDRYIATKISTFEVREIDGLKVAIVFAETLQSQIGNELAKAHDEIDLVAIISFGKSISFRAVKENVNVGEFAKKFGGGGHRKASGCEIKAENIGKTIDLLLDIHGFSC